MTPAETLKLLADESRLAIFTALKKRAAYPGDLAKALGTTPSAVSQHLRLLKGAGLLEAERKGNKIRYRVRHETLRDFATVFGSICFCRCDCCKEG